MSKNLIVFTIDDNFVEPFCVAISSFICHHHVDEFKIGLVYSDIQESKLNKIRKYFRKNKLDLIEKKIDDRFKKIRVGYHFNSVIFYRLLIPELFPFEEKVLYTDADMLFLGSVSPLFDIDLVEKNAILAAVPKTLVSGVPIHLKGKIDRYFASGFLLINVQEYNRKKILSKAERFLEEGKYNMPDQDALNCVVTNWVELDLKYGVETSFLRKAREKGFEKLQSVLANRVIIQFSGPSKPWKYESQHPYKMQYWDYLQNTPFRRKFPRDMPVKHKIAHFVCFFKNYSSGSKPFSREI